VELTSRVPLWEVKFNWAILVGYYLIGFYLLRWGKKNGKDKDLANSEHSVVGNNVVVVSEAKGNGGVLRCGTGRRGINY